MQMLKLNPKNITDKGIWRTVNPLFSDESIGNETITLVDNDESFQDELVVAEKFIISHTADTDHVLRAIFK